MFKRAHAKSEKEHVEDVYNEMPKRTASMVNTLGKIGDFISQNALHQPMIVLTAGCKHLIESRFPWEEELDPRFSLKTLYKQLESHRATILTPTAPYEIYMERFKSQL